MNETVTIKMPIKAKQFNGKNYSLTIEDADGVTHYFHNEHTIGGKKRKFKEGQYDGDEFPCHNRKTKKHHP